MSRPLTNIQRSLRALCEAGTLPRSPRIKWGAGTPDAPLQVPSGTESMRMNAALARVYASSSDAWRHARMKRSGAELPLCTWSGCGGRLNGVAVATVKRGGGGDAPNCAVVKMCQHHQRHGVLVASSAAASTGRSPIYGVLHVVPVCGLLNVVCASFGRVVECGRANGEKRAPCTRGVDLSRSLKDSYGCYPV